MINCIDSIRYLKVVKRRLKYNESGLVINCVALEGSDVEVH